MSNPCGIDAYWKFYREQSKNLDDIKVVFRKVLAKKKYINKLWKKEKELIKAKAAEIVKIEDNDDYIDVKMEEEEAKKEDIDKYVDVKLELL